MLNLNAVGMHIKYSELFKSPSLLDNIRRGTNLFKYSKLAIEGRGTYLLKEPTKKVELMLRNSFSRQFRDFECSKFYRLAPRKKFSPDHAIFLGDSDFY
jgi:hypothetical protein